MDDRDAATESNVIISGFLCPVCPGVVRLASEEMLKEHWRALHDDKAVKEDDEQFSLEDIDHQFEIVTLSTPKTCQLCSSVIWRYGLTCKSCRFSCHRRCVVDVVQNPDYKCTGTERFKQRTNAFVGMMRRAVTGAKARYVTDSFDLDLTYITPRIIAMSFPASGVEATYRNNLRDVAALLTEKHSDHYMVFNVSEKSYDISKLNNQVLDFGWPDHQAPPIERLCSICKSMGSWMASDPQNVCVVHCKGGKGRTGVVIAAYLNYSRLFHRAEDSMFQFAYKRFTNDDPEVTGITQASQRRYVHYFSQILAQELQIRPAPLLLKRVRISVVPPMSSRGTCRPVLKVYLNLTEEVFSTSDPQTFKVGPGGTGHFSVEIPCGPIGVVLDGDVLIRCFHRSAGTGRDVPMFRCQFHTAAIKDRHLALDASELDDAAQKIPDFAVVHFDFCPKYAPALAALPASGGAAQSLLNAYLAQGAALEKAGLRLPSPATRPRLATTTAQLKAAAAAATTATTATTTAPTIAFIPPFADTAVTTAPAPAPASSNPFHGDYHDADGNASQPVAVVAPRPHFVSDAFRSATPPASTGGSVLRRSPSEFRRSLSASSGSDAAAAAAAAAAVSLGTDTRTRFVPTPLGSPSAMPSTPPPSAVDNLEWYFPQMPAQVAERLLLEKAHPGQFIVRKEGARHMLSLRFEGGVRQEPMDWDATFKCFYLEDAPDVAAPSIAALVALIIGKTLTLPGLASPLEILGPFSVTTALRASTAPGARLPSVSADLS